MIKKDIIDWGVSSQSGTLGDCFDCGELKIVPYSNKRRFTLLVKSYIIQIHFVLTLHEELRIFSKRPFHS